MYKEFRPYHTVKAFVKTDELPIIRIGPSLALTDMIE